MQIRPLTIDDLDALNTLMVEIHTYHVQGEPRVFRGPDAPVFPRERVETGLASPDDYLIGAFDGAVLVGFLWAEYRVREASHTNNERRAVWVETLVVAQTHHKRGIGRHLMDAAEEWGRSRGATQALLTVWQFNESAIAFYECLGYQSEQIRMHKSLADDLPD